MADSFILLLLLAAVAAFLLYPIWKKRCGSCTTVTTTPGVPIVPGPAGPCFGVPSHVTVKPGIIDLSTCTDDVYIIRNNATQVKIISSITMCP